MPARKKTKSSKAKVTKTQKSSASFDHKAHAAKQNNSLMFLALACVALISSYWLFTNTMGGSMTKKKMPVATSTPSMMHSDDLVVQLVEQNNSGEYGNAVLSEKDGKTMVRVEVKNTPRGVSQPAHIHVGSCIAIGAIKYPLSNVVNGVSETVINVSMKELMEQGALALNVHKSASQLNQYVSCGNVSQ